MNFFDFNDFVFQTYFILYVYCRKKYTITQLGKDSVKL